MQCYAAVLLLAAVALCPAAEGRSAVIGLGEDDTAHGIEVLYGNFAGQQAEAAPGTDHGLQSWIQDSSKVQLTRYHVDTLIQSRFARTVVEVEIQNNGPARNTTVPFAIPENALLVSFEIDDGNGNVHEARPVLRDALDVDSNSTSKKATIQARNAEAFDLNLELAGSGTVVLRVVYEELLTKQRGVYTNVQQVWPGQTVADLKLSVRIREATPISGAASTFTGVTDIGVVSAPIDGLVSRVDVNDCEMLLTMQPTVKQQQDLASSLGLKPTDGPAGQFNVLYNVVRYDPAGDMVVSDGYFAHFFAPPDLEPMPKYAIFLLDLSGSLSKRTVRQLGDAMASILGQLGSDDVFTVIQFASNYMVWDLGWLPPGQAYHPTPTPATVCKVYSTDFVPIAQQRAKSMSGYGSSAVLGALLQAVACADSSAAGREPYVVLLTDSYSDEPADQILSEVAAANYRFGKPELLVTSISTLALGYNADNAFLRELALRHGGQFQQIYDGEDASEQMEDFYESISAPLLTKVRITLDNQQTDNSSRTRQDFRTYFKGSELVVAGRLLPSETATIYGLVTAKYRGQPVSFPIQVPRQSNWQPESLGGQANSERLWAFLHTKQLVDQAVLDGPTSSAANASTDMALQYSFVTPYTCLAVNITNPRPVPTSPTEPTSSPPAPSTPAPTSQPDPPTPAPAPSTPPPPPTGRPDPPTPAPSTPPPPPTGQPDPPTPAPAPSSTPTRRPDPPTPAPAPSTPPTRRPDPPTPAPAPSTPPTRHPDPPTPAPAPSTPPTRRPDPPTPAPAPSTPAPPPTGPPSPQTPATPVGPPRPATPPTPDNSGARNAISIGSISVGSMSVNGPLIQFNFS